MSRPSSNLAERAKEVNLCPKCGLQRQLVKTGNGNYSWRCKPCRYTKKFPDFIKQTPEEQRQKRLDRYNADPERFRRESREHRARNPNQAKEYQKRYAQENPEKIRETKRRYRQSEKGKAQAKKDSKKNRQKFKDKRREIARAWRKTESGRAAVYGTWHRRRAQKLKAPNRVTQKDIIALKRAFQHCIYCGCEGANTLEHVIPLEKEGHHTMDNLAIACKSCNSTKCHQFLESWALETNMHVFPMPRLPLISESPLQPELGQEPKQSPLVLALAMQNCFQAQSSEPRQPALQSEPQVSSLSAGIAQ